MLIKGNTFTDSRGTLRFVNDFHFEGVKRFYTITHPDTSFIRAWQGHKLETKYFYVTNGSFMVTWIEIDNWAQPSKDLKIHYKIITDKESELLLISPGCVNGFKAMEPDSTVVVFSDKTLEESKADDYRWELEYFDGWEIFHSETHG